jgi:hypothetical protein
MKMEVAWTTSPCRWVQNGFPKRWYHTTTLRGVTFQKTPTSVFNAEKTPDFSQGELLQPVNFSPTQQTIQLLPLVTGLYIFMKSF